MSRFHRSIKKEVEFPGMFIKNSWNFYGLWFLTLEFLPIRGVTPFCRIRTGESLFSKCKVTNLKIPGFFIKNNKISEKYQNEINYSLKSIKCCSNVFLLSVQLVQPFCVRIEKNINMFTVSEIQIIRKLHNLITTSFAGVFATVVR